MLEHPANEQIERFSSKAVSPESAASVIDHVTKCTRCHQLFVQALRSNKERLAFSLSDKDWSRHAHIDYDQILALTEVNFDHEDRENVKLHLNDCANCLEDLRSFTQFRKELAAELNVSYGPVDRTLKVKAPVGKWSWKPAYSLAILILSAITILVAAIVWKSGSSRFEAQNQPVPSSSPDAVPDNRESVPSPSVAPAAKSPPSGANPNAAVVVALNDAHGQITLTHDGELSGLNDLPLSYRQAIINALQNSTLPKPLNLKELTENHGGLRGADNDKFRLLSPVKTVNAEAQPMFRWQRLEGATSYRVYVLDHNGNEVAKSDDLPPVNTQWRPSKPLKRGEIYSWAVTAIVEGKEIVSPGPSSSEVKFQVLSSQSSIELKQLRKTNSHLVLGLFYVKVGMLPEAERELKELHRLNPHSDLTKRLAQSAQAARTKH